MKKYKHSDTFYRKQYNKFLEKAKSNPFRNFETFKSEYIAAEREGKTEIRKNFLYETNYEISWDTYKAERDAMREIGIKVKKSDLLSMSTTEFAKKYKEEIKQVYADFKQVGSTGKELKDFISEYFFGSL